MINIKRTPKTRPLKSHLIELLIIFTICIIAITIYSTYDYKKLQTSMIEDNNRLYATQLAKNTRQVYETYENICYSVAFNQAIQDYICETDPLKKYDEYQEMQNYLSNTANLDSYITDIAVIGKNGNSIALSGSTDSYEALADSLPSSRFSYQSMGIMTVKYIDSHILAMPVHRLQAGSSYLGAMFLAIDISRFFENGMPENAEYKPSVLFATSSEGELIYGDGKLYDAVLEAGENSESFSLKAGSATYAANHYSLSHLGYDLYVLVDKSQYSARTLQLAGRQLLWMAVILLFSGVLLLRFFHPLISSLNELTQFMKKITEGERKAAKEGITIKQGMFGCLEITNISDAFNEMLRETNRLNYTIFKTYTEMYELEMNNRNTEIAFLRSQINPHFLYNTLTAICGMASAGMTDEIISVTNALSQIFRYSIKGSDLVTVAEELEIVKSYLKIQLTRFEGRFTVRYDMSDDSYACLIPKMIIQPLVENAIVHGLEQSLKKGELLIGAGRNPEYGYLALWIYDTGVGMPSEKLEEIRRALKRSSRTKSGDARKDLLEMDEQNHESIGILNVNTRMTLYFGEEYSLLIDSEENVGTNIQLRIPYHTREESEKEADKNEVI
ncbi:sensor histidine kinase [Murimonas intestini]|uniref:Two-component system sensor histidine kinase YesM n=1 Tax=Murimonas intestini TaxID=1337051 RepID=A0AB73T755_9FIRM|nr:sensor histidine kinase [Murimonas intestini]MCR1841307.1 sensor histidine kinase [Murimonas intestini]MCR1866225.1 sensor histidine kinase [Murimonas intestini]MCR1882658.1 sensor histidine kinase [Murimonas intestini]